MKGWQVNVFLELSTHFTLYNPPATHLTSILDNLVNNLAILNVRLNLLRKRTFLGIFIRPLLRRKHDVNSRALTREHLRVQALLAQVDSSAVHLVEQKSRDDTVDLESELGRLDNVQTADERVDDDGDAGAVVDGDGVCLVVDLDDGLVTPGDEDGVVLCRGDIDDLAWVVVVLNEPLVAFEVLARGLAAAHALRLGLLAWHGGPGARHAV